MTIRHVDRKIFEKIENRDKKKVLGGDHKCLGGIDRFKKGFLQISTERFF